MFMLCGYTIETEYFNIYGLALFTPIVIASL